MYTYTNRTIQYRRLCCFRYKRLINFLTSAHSNTRRERHNSYYANYPQHMAHRVMFKISVSRDLKNPTTSFNGPNPTLCPNSRNSTLCLHGSNFNSQLTLFQNPQIFRTISSRHDVIHTPTPFPVWGLIMTVVIVISFAHEHKPKLNDKI